MAAIRYRDTLLLSIDAILTYSVSSDDVFQEARDSFLASLQPDTRATFATCASASDLITEVEKLSVVQLDRIRGQRLVRKIRSFADSLQPYFAAITIIVQCHPESAGVAWGALRLIFQVIEHCAHTRSHDTN